MYGTKFNLFQSGLPKSFNLIQKLGQHICPKELSWSPRQQARLLLSSNCDKEGTDNHVYQIAINYENPVASSIVSSFLVQGSLDFRICAQSRLINIIDFNKPQIYSFDTESGRSTKIFLPLAEYNITNIVRHTCDQDNNVLQVIGCTSNPKDCKLITYRADLAHKPYSRVHSVVDVTGKDSVYNHVASSFNDENDDTITIMTGESLGNMALYQIEIDGPHIRLGAEKVLDAGEFDINWGIRYPGETDLQVNVTEKFNLTLQKADLKIELLKKESKAPTQGRIDIEDYVEITGPFHSVGIQHPDGVTLYDRITPSNQLSTVTTTFDDAVFHKDFVFGYKKDAADTILILAQGGDEKVKIPDAPAASVFVVEKSATEYYFFAYVKRQLADDELYAVYTNDDGKTWKQSKSSLDN